MFTLSMCTETRGSPGGPCTQHESRDVLRPGVCAAILCTGHPKSSRFLRVWGRCTELHRSSFSGPSESRHIPYAWQKEKRIVSKCTKIAICMQVLLRQLTPAETRGTLVACRTKAASSAKPGAHKPKNTLNLHSSWMKLAPYRDRCNNACITFMSQERIGRNEVLQTPVNIRSSVRYSDVTVFLTIPEETFLFAFLLAVMAQAS